MHYLPFGARLNKGVFMGTLLNRGFKAFGAVCGVAKRIRTSGLPLRSDLGTRALSHFLYPIIPYFQGFFVL